MDDFIDEPYCERSTWGSRCKVSEISVPVQPEKLAVEALKMEIETIIGSGFVIDNHPLQIASDVIDHLSANYDFIRKV